MAGKKGSTLGIVMLVASCIIIIVFLAGWLYFSNVLTNALLSTGITEGVNVTDAVSKTLVPVNNSMNGLIAISYILIFSLIIGSLIEGYYVKKHPILFVVHLFIVIGAIVASIYISNVYDTIASSSILSTQLQTFTGSNFVMQYLPYIITIVGLITILVMLININKDPRMEAQTV